MLFRFSGNRSAAFLVALTTYTGVALGQGPGNPITGIAVDETGRAVSGATVSLLNSRDAVERTVSTADDGSFSISGVVPGRYGLRAEAKGLESAKSDIDVNSGAAPTPVRIVLHIAAIRQTVSVTGEVPYAVTEASAATKQDLPLMDVPVSVHVIPAAVLADQQVISLDAAIQNVSGVVISNDGYGASDSFTIRGFDQLLLSYEDGLRTDAYTNSGFTRDMANIEQVEVVKGPESVLYGQSEPGGLVNVVTKKPLDTPYFSVQQQFGTYGLYRTTLDASGPLGTHKLLYRLNLDYNQANSFRDFVNSRRLAVFPTLEWKPGKHDQLIVEAYYSGGHLISDNGIPFLPNGTPANVPLSRNYVDPGSNSGHIVEKSIKMLGTHSFAEEWKARVTYRTGSISDPSLSTQVYIGDTDPSGNLARFGLTSAYFYHWTNQVDTNLNGEFNTGALHHNVIIGFDYYNDAGRYDANTYFPATINIYNPVYNQPFAPPDPANDFYVSNGETAYGAYIQDHITLPHHLHLLVGMRFDRVNSYDTGFPQAADVHDRPAPTPRAGLVWQPVAPLSLYTSFTGSYGVTALGALTVAGKPLPPEGGHQYEAGVKTEWFNKRLVATAAVYQIVKTNVPAADPQNPLYSIALGEARSRGVEFDISGQITSSLRVIGGFSYIDGVITKDANSPSLAGLRFPGVPYDSGSIWGVYESRNGKVKGFRFGAGVVARTGELAWESPDGVSYMADRIPGFAIVNLMMGHSWQAEKARLTLQVNANNVLNKAYFATVNPSQALPGAPFTIMPSLRVQF